MITKYNNFKSEKMSGPREILPAGGYVGKIMSTRVEDYNWGSVLILAYDIIEGEYAGFWKRDFDNNPNEDKKWRGTLRMTIPDDSGTTENGWRQRAFNNMVACFEDSNSGFHWDWDEQKLKGKAVGILVREREWEMNGNTGWTTEASSVTTVDAIRNGKFRIPKPKKLQNHAETAEAPAAYASVEDVGELPF